MNRIKELREAKGWTQAELAERLGVSASIIGLYEQGRRKPSFEACQSLSVLFEEPVENIVDARIRKFRVAANSTVQLPASDDAAIELYKKLSSDEEGQKLLANLVKEQISKVSTTHIDTSAARAIGKLFAGSVTNETQQAKINIIKEFVATDLTAEQLKTFESLLKAFKA